MSEFWKEGSKDSKLRCHFCKMWFGAHLNDPGPLFGRLYPQCTFTSLVFVRPCMRSCVPAARRFGVCWYCERASASRTPWTPSRHTASTLVRNFCVASGHLKSQVTCEWMIIGWSTRCFACCGHRAHHQQCEALAHVEDAFLEACGVFADGSGVSSTIARSVHHDTDECTIVIFQVTAAEGRLGVCSLDVDSAWLMMFEFIFA